MASDSLDSALEEYKALRTEVAETNKQQFQLATALSALSVASSLGALLGVYAKPDSVICVDQWTCIWLFLAALTLCQIVFLLQMNLRVMALSSRLTAVEKTIRNTCGSHLVMRWESEYVPKVFSGLTAKLMDAFWVVPLGMVYVGDIAAAYLFGDLAKQNPLWLLVAGVPVAVVYILYSTRSKELDAALKALHGPEVTRRLARRHESR